MSTFILYLFPLDLRYMRYKKKLNLNTSRCECRKIYRGSVLSLPLPLISSCCSTTGFSSKEGWTCVDDKGEIGQLCTARDKKTSRVLGPCHAKVLLASGEMTST